jgi:hypothetical protein
LTPVRKCGRRKGWWLGHRKLVECTYCHKQTSVTAGTVFHRIRTPLWKWFWAIYQLAQDKNMKRMILGTYHSVSPKHLDNYLAEFTYRANRRWMEANLFDRLLIAAVNAKPMNYRQLVTGGS